MYESPIILRPPYIKGKGSCFNPIVKYGIPAYADSKLNPKVKGTQAWREFWEEQLYYIHNGVQVGGLFIPGRFYYYMNFSVMGNIERGNITPDMVDLHLELAYLIEYVKAHGKNLICAKGRRKGISEFTHKAVIDYGWRFNYSYKAGVVSGKSKYVTEFISKWTFGDMHLPPELSVNYHGTGKIISGYEQKNSLGAWVNEGTQNIILSETVHLDPNPLKGYYFNDVVVEEVGETERAEEFYSATIDSLKSGDKQVGTMFLYGTGGNVNKGSKGFKKIWNDPEDFNAVKFMAPATRFYLYGGASLPQHQLPLESELCKKYKPYQILGCEDLILSKEKILDKRKKAEKSGNTKKYNEELQNNPLDEKEIFRKTNQNNFNLEKINVQLQKLEAAENKEYVRYILEWKKDLKTGLRLATMEVTVRPATPLDKEEDSVYILPSEHPRKGFKNLYCAGLDSYDQNSAMTKSLGGMCVLIRENAINGAMKKAPVAVIRTRPARKEKFYEMCLMLASYYNIIGNVLGDVRCPGILQFWKEWGGDRFIAQRPAKFESPNTEAGHDYWMSINRYSKPMMVGVMETHIEDYIDQIKFPVLLNEVADYDIDTMDSDNDLADAYGIALVQDMCCELKPKDTTKEDDYNDIINLPEFGRDGNFLTERPDLESEEQDWEGFGQK